MIELCRPRLQCGASASPRDLRRLQVHLPRKFWLCVTESSSTLLRLSAYVCVCVCVSHPEGLIETVVLVLVRKSPPPVLWMEGYNLRATQHTTGNSSNGTMEPSTQRRILYQHGAHGHTGDCCCMQHTYTHALTRRRICMNFDNNNNIKKKHGPTNLFIHYTQAHVNMSVHTCSARD